MSWFKKAIVNMTLDWNTAYTELLEELGRVPTSKEVIGRMHHDTAPLHDKENPEAFEFPDADMKFEDLPF